MSLESQAIEAVQAVRVVQVVEGRKRRKPLGFELISFYGKNDWWIYHAIKDTKLCDKCKAFFMQRVFNGRELIDSFEYHVILDENLIAAMVHPHCRCYLTRLYKIEEPE